MKNKGFIKSAISVCIFTVFLIWMTPFLNKKADELLKSSLKPNVNVEIYEKGNTQIGFSIEATHKNTSIKTLSLKFDIPGLFKDYRFTIQDRVGDCTINHTPRMGNIKEDIYV